MPPHQSIQYRFSLLLFCCLLSATVNAQIGFTGAYYTQQIPEWEAALFGDRTNEKLVPKGYTFGVDYWLKPLKDYRVELYPELAVSFAKSDITRNGLPETFELASVGFNLNTNIYVLNIESDCGCPTFSKPESFIEKGVFLQISPGIQYLKGTYEGTADIELEGVTTLVPKLGLGIGLDIGLSDFITITPIFKYNRLFNAEWEGLTDMVNNPTISTIPGNNKSNINQFSAGLHVGIRWRE